MAEKFPHIETVVVTKKPNYPYVVVSVEAEHHNYLHMGLAVKVLNRLHNGEPVTRQDLLDCIDYEADTPDERPDWFFSNDDNQLKDELGELQDLVEVDSYLANELLNDDNYDNPLWL